VIAGRIPSRLIADRIRTLVLSQDATLSTTAIIITLPWCRLT
jgi:hypothetical protein